MAAFDKALWKELHALTGQEKDLIKRFESDPTGPAFVSVADILRKRAYLDEAIVVLEEGLRKFPQFHSARAALARDYFHKGLMHEALRELDSVLARSPDNLMAQRLRVRLALVFDEPSEAQSRLGLLRQLSPDDEFTRGVRDAMAREGWFDARERYLAELERQGVRGFWNASTATRPVPSLSSSATSNATYGTNPTNPTNATNPTGPRSEGTTSSHPSSADTWRLPVAGGGASFTESDAMAARAGTADPFSEFDAGRLPEAFSSGGSLANVRGDADRYMLLRGFKMVGGSPGAVAETLRGAEGGEATSALESTTLAGIYESQGLPLKALAIYEKILKDRPNDEELFARAESARRASRSQLAGRAGAARLEAGDATREEKIRKLERLLMRLETLP